MMFQSSITQCIQCWEIWSMLLGLSVYTVPIVIVAFSATGSLEMRFSQDR